MNTTLKNIIRKTSIVLLSSSPLFSINLYADDTEIFTGATSGGFEDQIRPNILYVVDTSGSMKSDPGFFIDPVNWWDGPYDPTVDYSAFGSCDRNTVYYDTISSSEVDSTGAPWTNAEGYPVKTDGGTSNNLPDCSGGNFPKAAMACANALTDLDTKGWYVDYFGSYWPFGSSLNGRTMDGEWHSFLTSDHDGVGTHDGGTLWRECTADFGNHGDTTGDSKVYPNKESDSYINPWTSAPGSAYTSYLSNNDYIMADGNFLNWFYAVPQSRNGAVKVALKDIVRDLPAETVIGLMHFDSGATGSTGGGMMVKEFVEVGEGTNRQDFIDVIRALPNETTGPTPLGETLMEAAYAFGGKPVYFGNDTANDAGAAYPSVPESRRSPVDTDPDYKLYKSPITYSCQSNNVIFLSDGAPTADDDAWPGKSSLDSLAGISGGFEHLPNYDTYAPTDCDDWCLEFIAEYMANEDMNDDIAGPQTIKVSTIGFGGDLDNSEQDFLRRTAEKGQGTFVMANSFDELKDAFKVTTRKAITANTAFAAPALAVNAFNRTQDGNRIYFALFRTSTEPGWGGNLKAYELAAQPDGSIAIEDAAGEPAVDPDTGLFHFYSRSIWSAAADGNDALLGGAASNLDDGNRNIYTWINGSDGDPLIDPDNAFAAWNSGHANFTDAMFGLDGTESYTRADLMNWLGGVDPTTGIGRRHMGDPLHSRPVVVTYGTTDADPDQKIFVTTNDGMLHIIDADTGVEDFAFIAEETLKNAKRLYEGDASAGKAYGLDGALQLYIDEGAAYEPGISGGDKAYLYAGMRRGGRTYYAFDMTNPASPKILWRITGGDVDMDGTDNDPFYYLGQTFSTPQLGELKIAGSARKVLIFGGGYDTRQDDPDGSGGTTSDPYVRDEMGHAIYIVDALTGDRLWWASGNNGADLYIPEMINSIPSDVAVIDIDNDGWTDRLYVGDTGGRIFRIDLEEFNDDPYWISSTGGMIADIGGSSETITNADGTSESITHPDDKSIPNNRKLFYAPDIVRVENGNDDYLAVAFGTGNRAHPSYPIIGDTAVEDKFFVLKDPHILTKPGTSPASYDYGIRMGDGGHLYNATDNLVMSADTGVRDTAVTAMNTAKGWYIDLEHEGEKALAPAVTLNYKTYFTTFEPLDLDLSTCQARTGIGRLYTIDIRNGKPVNANYYAAVPGDDPDTTLETEDRIYELSRDGIPPAFTFTFPEAAGGAGVGLVATETPPADPGANVQRSYWRTQ
jgi:type IV pilus assembly protein PilY1